MRQFSIHRWRAIYVVIWVSQCSIGHASLRDLSATRVAAFVDQQAPGTPDGTSFKDFDAPVINNAGQTAFRANIGPADALAGNQLGMWFEGAGRLNVAALESTQPAAFRSDTITKSRFAFNSQGRFTFYDGNAIWTATPDGVARDVQVGDDVPSEPGRTFKSVGRPIVNKDGTIAFLAWQGEQADFRSRQGIWAANNGSLSAIAHEGPVPDAGPYQYFSNHFSSPRINSAGRVAFSDGYMIWTNARGPFEPALQIHSTPPGFASDVYFSYPQSLAINSRGDVFFHVPMYVTGQPVQSPNDWDSYWRFREGQLQMIARVGDQVPGFPIGIVFDGIGNDLMSESGDVAFLATLSGPGIDATNRSSIWRLRGDDLQLIAQSGMQAPGLETGIKLGQLDTPQINGRGQVAFSARLTGLDPTFGAVYAGIWAEDSNADLQLVVHKDDRIDVDPGPEIDMRVVNTLLVAGEEPYGGGNFFRGEGDQVYAFNDLGQVAFKATFVGGGVGLFVSGPSMIPEPNTILLVGIAAYLMTIKRRRRHAN